MSASEYILEVKTIIDHQLQLDDLMIFIVGGLGSNFNFTFFITFMNMSEHKPFKNALRGMLETYDHMLSKQGRL